MADLRLTVEEDESQPGGHARLMVPRDLGERAPVRLSISRRSGDAPHLGRSGWQAAPVVLEVPVIQRGAGKTVLGLGPAICEWIPVDQQIRLEIEGQGITGSAFWPEISPTLGAWAGQLGGDPPVATALPAMAPPPQPAPQPAPVTEEARPAPPPVTPAKKQGGKGLLLVLSVLLIAALGAAVWFLGDEEKGEVPQPVAVETPGESLAARFERLKVEDAEGDQLVALSEEAWTVPDAGIGLGALRLAFERGNQDAKYLLARLLDPLSADPARLAPPEAPDANLAARYYLEMCFLGDARAAQSLVALCAEADNPASPHAGRFEGLARGIYCEGDCSG